MSTLNMYLITVRFVPRLLALKQKQYHVEVCEELRQQAWDDHIEDH